MPMGRWADGRYELDPSVSGSKSGFFAAEERDPSSPEDARAGTLGAADGDGAAAVPEDGGTSEQPGPDAEAAGDVESPPEDDDRFLDAEPRSPDTVLQ